METEQKYTAYINSSQILQTTISSGYVRLPPFRKHFLIQGHPSIEVKWSSFMHERKNIYKSEKVSREALIKSMHEFYYGEMETLSKDSKYIGANVLPEFHKQISLAMITGLHNEAVHVLTPCEVTAVLDNFFQDNAFKFNLRPGSLKHAEEDLAIGIDLGTCNLCVAVYINGKVNPILNKAGKITTPSYISFNNDGSETVGQNARMNCYRNPEYTVFDCKRVIGRTFADPSLHLDRRVWPFTIVQEEENGTPKYILPKEHLTAVKVSSLLLKECVAIAEESLQQKVTKAVITVPAYFNESQINATKAAGELAGLEVLKLMKEPTAAAVMYRYEQNCELSKLVLVFDVGGGTFDVALVKISGPGIEILGTDGDTHLGGEDFDFKLVDYCIDQYKKTTGQDIRCLGDDHNGGKIVSLLKLKCEKAKRDLSWETKAHIVLRDLKNFEVVVTRELFEELCKPLFDRMMTILDEFLRSHEVVKSDIEDIVLVGGSTRNPRIKRMLMEYFDGKRLNFNINQAHAVAYGAAIYAAATNGDEIKKLCGHKHSENWVKTDTNVHQSYRAVRKSNCVNQVIDRVIGSPDCTINDIMTSMEECGANELFVKEWRSVARALQTESNTADSISQNIEAKAMTAGDILEVLLVEWRTRVLKKATLVQFIKGLKLSGVQNFAEDLENRFRDIAFDVSYKENLQLPRDELPDSLLKRPLMRKVERKTSVSSQSQCNVLNALLSGIVGIILLLVIIYMYDLFNKGIPDGDSQDLPNPTLAPIQMRESRLTSVADVEKAQSTSIDTPTAEGDCIQIVAKSIIEYKEAMLNLQKPHNICLTIDIIKTSDWPTNVSFMSSQSIKCITVIYGMPHDTILEVLRKFPNAVSLTLVTKLSNCHFTHKQALTQSRRKYHLVNLKNLILKNFFTCTQPIEILSEMYTVPSIKTVEMLNGTVAVENVLTFQKLLKNFRFSLESIVLRPDKLDVPLFYNFSSVMSKVVNFEFHTLSQSTADNDLSIYQVPEITPNARNLILTNTIISWQSFMKFYSLSDLEYLELGVRVPEAVTISYDTFERFGNLKHGNVFMHFESPQLCKVHGKWPAEKKPKMRLKFNCVIQNAKG